MRLSASFDAAELAHGRMSLELIPQSSRPRSAGPTDDPEEFYMAAASRPASGDQVYVLSGTNSWVRAGNATLALVEGSMSLVSPGFARALRLPVIVDPASGQRQCVLRLRLLNRELSVIAAFGPDGSPDIQMGDDLQMELEQLGVEPTIRPDFGDPPSMASSFDSASGVGGAPLVSTSTMSTSSASNSMNLSHSSSSGGLFSSAGGSRSSADAYRSSGSSVQHVVEGKDGKRLSSNATASSFLELPEFMRVSGRSWFQMTEEDDEVFFAI